MADNDLVIYTDEETFQITLDDDGIEVVVAAVGFDETAAAQAAQAAAEAAEVAAAASATAAAASAASAGAAAAAAVASVAADLATLAASVTDDQIALKAQVFN